MEATSGLARCEFGDPLSIQSGRKYSAVGWYGLTRAYGDSRLAVKLCYTFANIPIPGLPVPCTLESLAGCEFCVKVEICALGLSPHRVVQGMIAMETSEGANAAVRAAEAEDQWRLYSEKAYNPRCEAALFSDEKYREQYKALCEPRRLVRAFSAALATVNARCNYVYLGDIAAILGARPAEGVSVQNIVASPGASTVYCDMNRIQLEAELRALGDDDAARCAKHYICQLLASPIV